MYLLCVAAQIALSLHAAAPRALTAKDYAEAERFMSYNVTPLVFNANIMPSFIGQSDRFWYRSTKPGGSEFELVDPVTGTKRPAFDHARLAAALGIASDTKVDAGNLPFTSIDFTSDLSSVSFTASGKRYTCRLDTYQCTPGGGAPSRPQTGRRFGAGGGGVPSPNGRQIAFIRNDNLWVRDMPGGKETQLTTDGVKDYGYATDNAGWTKSDRPILLWSPDSKKIATYQQDQRKVGDMYLVTTNVGHPTLEAWKYPLPGDPVIPTLRRVIIDIPSHRVLALKMDPDPHRSTLGDDVAGFGGWNDVQWSPDGSKLAFVSSSRDHKEAKLREADAETGDVREVYDETVPTQFESGDGRTNWSVLWGEGKFIWYSEKSGFGHLYLGDWKSGQILGQITSGDWLVREVVRVAEKSRTVYFLGAGREKGNPYFTYLYRVGLDGAGLQLLTPELANHNVTVSPSGEFFVDSYSQPDVPPVTVLRDSSGSLTSKLEASDVSKLLATGWRPPTPIIVKARDGVTDLYGLMYMPTRLNKKAKYPIVNNIYPGPQGGSVGGWSFSAARGDAQSLAELGFVVVQIDGMGNPTRSKKFHDFYYGNMGDNTLPDQVAAMKEIAKRYSFVDIDKAGIYGHSGGGFATADAMFRFPDFFKVGISEAGNHDNRNYEDDWGERYQGLLTTNPDGTTNYDNQANELVAKNLKGHLLLAHGTTDSNVPPYNTLLVVDALIKANKDFDLLLLPNRNHGFGGEPYMVRRRWDYFVRYLLGAEPPKEYELKPPAAMPGAF